VNVSRISFISQYCIVLVELSTTTISPEEVDARADEELYVLDIRPTYSFEENHIEGSHNIPVYDQLKGRNFLGLEVAADELPEDTEIAVVCFSGSTATLAVQWLRKHGFDAKTMVGGISGWQGATTGSVSAGETA
jgi:rhodanese-related sulfurtransferase